MAPRGTSTSEIWTLILRKFETKTRPVLERKIQVEKMVLTWNKMVPSQSQVWRLLVGLNFDIPWLEIDRNDACSDFQNGLLCSKQVEAFIPSISCAYGLSTSLMKLMTTSELEIQLTGRMKCHSPRGLSPAKKKQSQKPSNLKWI